ncbi:MAG: hypothetical protein [Caudoviricetes sp.]|nr:MAG: hypothetical protein [Caudoviricetes sp.]
MSLAHDLKQLYHRAVAAEQLHNEIVEQRDSQQQIIEDHAAEIHQLTGKCEEYRRHLTANIQANQKRAARILELETQLATLSPTQQESHRAANDMRAMHDQLQELSCRLVAIENDSANYHHLLQLIGAKSMVQAISWIQFHHKRPVEDCVAEVRVHSDRVRGAAGEAEFCHGRDQAARK